ncbi:ABC transporter substrate-binding protein [Peribacillus loiseleuriae]|uniref:ABC transporter substrate-binding protein n=1 Tax=Peribacillus loiseleuriae TaxID=1679170 RepID=UPI0037FEAE0B
MLKMIKSLSVVSAIALSLSACSSSDSATKKEKLVISTWGFSEDFFREEVYKPFEEEHNIEIVLDSGNNADRLNKIRQGNSDVDVIYLSDYYAEQGIQDGLFEKIDRSAIPNIGDIYEKAQAPTGEEYGPAYTIAQFGIAYNPGEIKKPITSWADLWNKDLNGMMTIPGITSTTGPMFLDVASKVSGNTKFNEDAAFTKLKELMPNVLKEYNQTSEFINMFAQGEIAGGPIMEMYFSQLREAVPDAQFVSPKEGGYAVMNTVNIVKGSNQKKLAEEFINYILSEGVQEKSARAKVDSPVNKKVQLTEKEARGLTYGGNVINSLNFLDMNFVNKNSKQWIDRWNKELAQ